jgi:hypothetical protein
MPREVDLFYILHSTMCSVYSEPQQGARSQISERRRRVRCSRVVVPSAARAAPRRADHRHPPPPSAPARMGASVASTSLSATFSRSPRAPAMAGATTWVVFLTRQDRWGGPRGRSAQPPAVTPPAQSYIFMLGYHTPQRPKLLRPKGRS